ncbi:hypothetical protein LDENG_00298210 [Lucifuga dentata]|nr:hypothetical protein LDENG_00298210 [Lucifuga dentata]
MLSSKQILTSLHIPLPHQTWVHLHPPLQTISSLTSLTVLCRAERRLHPVLALLASLVTVSTKTSSPSTAPSWLLL